MIIKWHKNVVKFKNIKIKLSHDVLCAERFKDWAVVATSTALYFFGSEEHVLPFSIYSVFFTENFIYFHSREDKSVYKLSHPLEEEVFLFYSPHYILDKVIIQRNVNNYEDPIYILNFNKTYVLKRHKSYFVYFIKLGEVIKHILADCSFEEFINVKGPRSFSQPEEDLQINIDDSKEGIEFVSKVNSSLDDKITNLKVEDTLNIHTHEHYLIVMCNNLVSFIDFSTFSENELNLVKSKTYELSKDIEIFKPIRMNFKKSFSLTVFQINNLLFYESKMIQIIDDKSWISAFKPKKYSRNYHDIFWKKINSIDRKIFACLEPESIISLIGDCIATNDYNFFKLKITHKHIEKINQILVNDLTRRATIEEFLEKNSSYSFFGKIPIIHKIQNLNKCRNYILSTDNYNKLIEIRYERIFNFDASLLVGMKFGNIRNLAYQIIFLEENKTKIFLESSNVRKWERYRKLFFRNFNDARMDEVDLLFNEKPKQFDLENETENINEKAYVLRLSCSLGKSLAYYNSMDKEDIFRDKPLVYPMLKNLGLVNIEIKDKNWKNWPSFNYTCCRFLSSSNLADISVCFIENRFKSFIKDNDDSEHILSGMLYALGVRKKFGYIAFEDIKDLINDNMPLASMVLLVSYGLNNQGRKSQELFDNFNLKIHTDTHPLIKIGYYIGLSYTLMNSGNVNMKNQLIREIDKYGAIDTERHNKNNILWYNKTYKLTMAFMIAYVFKSKTLEGYEFIRLKNRLSELLINGLILFNTNTSRYIKSLKRTKGDSLEEIFYSEFFTLGCSSPDNIGDILDYMKEENMNIFTIYKYAGALFYIGVASIVKGIDIDGRLYDKLFDLAVYFEDRMVRDDKFRIIFDYCLISLSLIKNSSCDLELLKLIRRQIKRTERVVCDRNKVDYIFTFNGMKKEVQTTLTYGNIEKYKLCLGILTLGLSKYKLTGNINTVIDLVIAFYIDFPICTQDQDYFNLLRYNIFNSIGRSDKPSFNLFYKFKNGKNTFSEISSYFKRKFKTLSEPDKKLVIDLLSDYYENHLNGEPLIDIEYFKEFVIRCK